VSTKTYTCQHRVVGFMTPSVQSKRGAKFISYWRRQCDFEKFFLFAEAVVYCNDADVLFRALGPVHVPDEW
jgi:hypothetical protein